VASAGSPTCLAARRAIRTRDASDRLLPSHFFVRAPVPRWFPARIHELALRALPGHRLNVTSERFASAGRTRVICPPRRALSSPRGVCGRASGIPVASPAMTPSLARRSHAGSCRGRAPVRPRERGEREMRPEMPSVRQGPSPRNALSSARLGPSRAYGLAAVTRAISAFSPHPCLESPSGARPPSTRPVAGGTRFSEPWRCLPTSAT
jgi:hypothetical protein